MANRLRVVAPPGEIAGGSAEPTAFLGTSRAAQEIRARVARAARVDATVLICGESGVGKELVAREIHARSTRAARPFVALNCAAIPESLIEAELFGHEPGAFTDARNLRRGAFERAHRGTLFLDEVGDLSQAAQPKLLRALESGEIVRVGGESPRFVDLRIIAATNQDLGAMWRHGSFRADLLYRLRVLCIEVPPLRARPEDVPVLARHFLLAMAVATGEAPREISARAMDRLVRHAWPGNVRELRSALERAVTMSPERILDEGAFELDPSCVPGPRLDELLTLEWREARDAFAALYAGSVLRQNGGNVRRAARSAGLARRSLYKMIDRLGLRADRDLSRPSG